MAPQRTLEMRLPLFIYGLTIFLASLAISFGIAWFGLGAVFNEGQPGTWASFVLLLTIALVSARIYVLRNGSVRPQNLNNPANVWLLAAGGFVFLGADEIFLLHENFDMFIHSLFEIDETPLTDRLDDAIVGIYGLVGLGVLYVYRRELFRTPNLTAMFVLGFILLFVMVALDIFTNREDLVILFFGDALWQVAFAWMRVEEDILKVTAEIVFLYVFIQIFKRSLASPNGSNGSTSA